MKAWIPRFPAFAAGTAVLGSAVRPSEDTEGWVVADVIYVLLTVLFFVVALLALKAVDRL